MTLRRQSLLVLSLCAVLFGAACKKKEDAAAGSGSATATASGSASASASGSGSATAAPPAVDAAEAAAPAVDAAEAAAPSGASTPELDALDKTVAPILAMSDAEAGAKAACKELPTITKQMQAVTKTVPAGVDAAAWTDAADRMVGALSDFEIECGEDSASDTKALAKSMDIAKELKALAAKKAP